jgi:hypothetical protein
MQKSFFQKEHPVDEEFLLPKHNLREQSTTQPHTHTQCTLLFGTPIPQFRTSSQFMKNRLSTKFQASFLPHCFSYVGSLSSNDTSRITVGSNPNLLKASPFSICSHRGVARGRGALEAILRDHPSSSVPTHPPHQSIGMWRGVSKGVEDGRKPPALREGHLSDGPKAVSGGARLQGVEG